MSYRQICPEVKPSFLSEIRRYSEIDLVCKETRRRQRRGKRGDETVDIQAAKAASDAASIFSAVILPPGDITVSTLKWTSDPKSAMVLGKAYPGLQSCITMWSAPTARFTTCLLLKIQPQVFQPFFGKC